MPVHLALFKVFTVPICPQKSMYLIPIAVSNSVKTTYPRFPLNPQGPIQVKNSAS